MEPQVLGPEDFNQQVDLITKAVALQSQNTLSVELRSAPGRAIVITINGRFPSVTETVPAKGGSITLNGLASVAFPSGAFTAAHSVTMTVTNSPDVHESFSATAEGPRLPYEIRINSGSVPPSTSFDVTVNVPEAFVSAILPERQLEIFARPIEADANEALGHFWGFPSVFDSATRILRTTLPPEAFSNESTDDGSYEAVIVVGDIPKYPPTVGTQGSAPSSSRASLQKQNITVASLTLFGLLAAASDVCEGSPLGLPLDIELIISRPFNPTSHPAIDYPAPMGTPVHPVLPGIVTRVTDQVKTRKTPHPVTGKLIEGWGRYVVITHTDGSQTLYAHLIPESTGHLEENVTQVTPSDVIGQVGVSGGVSGPHLHLEYSPEGRIFVKRSLRNPHPCIEAGRSPLVLSPQNPTLTCSSGSVQFTATGGRPPYTWSSTTGVRTVTGANSENMTLTAPANPGPSVQGIAYVRNLMQKNTATCSIDRLGYSMHLCDGSFFRYDSTYAGSLAGVTGGDVVCRDVTCGDNSLPICNLPDWGPIAQTTGKVFDLRDQDMKNQGCRPCAVEMNDTTVTLTDGNGTTISTTVTVH